MLVGVSRDINRATDGSVRYLETSSPYWMPADDHLAENPAAKKKSAEKVLIPLPPTGSTSTFLQKLRGGQLKQRPRSWRGLWVIQQLHRVQSFEKKCSGLAQRLSMASEIPDLYDPRFARGLV